MLLPGLLSLTMKTNIVMLMMINKTMEIIMMAGQKAADEEWVAADAIVMTIDMRMVMARMGLANNHIPLRPVSCNLRIVTLMPGMPKMRLTAICNIEAGPNIAPMSE